MNSDEQKLAGALQKIFSSDKWLQQKTVVRIGGQVHPFLERLIANHRIINVDISPSYIQTQYRLDIQADAHSLPMIPDGSVDMVVSSHTLEHLTNPVKALKEWRRILRDAGVLCLAVPYYKKTFDHKRKVTTLQHFISDYQTKVGLDDASHTKEFLENFDITKDFCFKSYDLWHKNYLTNPQIYTHYHVFDLEAVRTLCEFTGFETNEVFHRDIGIDYFGRKASVGTKVSIAIPCYEMHGKGVEFLNYSFAKIHSQTYKNIEVVISDHSQNDDIQKLCERWRGLLKIVYVRYNENRGNSSANLNNAIRRCSGEIVKVLFQDDYLFHEKSIEDIVSMFKGHPDKYWLVTASEHTKDGITYLRSFYPSYNDSIHLGNNTISSPSVLAFRNKDILYFDESLIWLMDCDYYKRLYSRFGKPLVMDRVNVVNRLWESQVSALLDDEVKNKEVLRMREKYKPAEELKRGKIYIAVPYRYETGGVEALHQLAHKLNLSGFSCYLLYKSSAFSDVLSGGKPPSGVYDEYKAQEALEVEDSSDNILIVPEVWTKLLDKYNNIRKCIWWLSVDNNLRSPEGDYQSWGDKNVIHFFQSHYAAQYVRAHGVDGCYIGEYLNKSHFTQSRGGICRKNIVLYNPAKGLQTTQAIINALKMEQIEFIPLNGFNVRELLYLYGISKVYIDFGNHPGMDRIPREAVIGGCCVIVGKKGAANNAVDIPIPWEYKIEDGDIALAATKIKECIENYEARTKDFEGYRYIISRQEQKMEMDVSSVFGALTAPQERKDNLCLIFSKDRAMQLQATIDSFVLHCRDNDAANIVVLFKTSDEVHRRQYDVLKKKFPAVAFVEETDFSRQVLSLVERSKYVLFLVDDNIFVKPFSIGDITAAFEAEKRAIGFSLRLGKNTGCCYSLSSPQKLPEFGRLKDGILKYNWPGTECDFGYPLEVSSSIYRSAEILNLLNQLEFSNPNTLEGQMNRNIGKFASSLPILLTFEESVTFCNPVNIVQCVYENNKFGKTHRYTPEQLADGFSRGMAIDVQKYAGFTPGSAHQEVELFFKSSDLTVTSQKKTEAVKPEFSVVMANYNNSRYIGPAIESVRRQTFKDWELLIVDDCSTDDSVDIIKPYLTDSRIRLIRHDANKGYVTALKTGIAAVKSELFGILDSDDCLSPNAVEIMYQQHISSPDCGLIYSQFMYCDENLKPKHAGFCREIPPGKTNLDVNTVSHFKTFKLSHYLKTSGYDESILYAEDKDIIYKMEEVTRLKFVNDCLYLFRELPNSAGHDVRKAAIGRESMNRSQSAAVERRGRTCPAAEYFLRAQEEFRKGDFQKAAEFISTYEKTIDFSKFMRQINRSRRKQSIDVSVVIVTYNRTGDVKKCLDSLTKQDDRNFEVIVVDNGGTDFEQIRQYVDQYIKCPINFNLSEGRNIGVCCAKGKIVAFLDDDALVPINYVGSIKAAFQKYDIYGLRGRAYPKSNPDANKSVSIYNLGDSPFPSYCNQEGNSAFRRDIYLEMCGMDPLLFGHEGSDLTYRIIRAYKQPNKVIYWPWTIIYHDFGSPEKMVEKKKQHQLSADYLKFKHNVDIFVNRKEIESCPLPIKQTFVPQAQNHPAPKSLVTSAIAGGSIKPKVSIVIACHNSQQFLPQCLDSIRNQTMGEWELLILDDASTDGTRDIIENYSRMDARIKPSYFKDKQGPYVRRNFAIERAACDFIVIQDSDDIMCPVKLQRLYEEIIKDKRLGVVGSFYRLFLDEFKGLEYTEGVELPLIHEQIMEKYKMHLYICWHASAIIRKSVFDAIGLYDENPYGSDKLWLAKAAEYVQYTGEITFANIPEYLTLKREHASSQQGVLPPIDPRSRRAMFQTYWVEKFSKIREKFQKTPGLDIKAELKNCKCNDYIQRFSHLFEKWESQPLDWKMLYKFVSRGIIKFNEGRHVTCLITLDGVEKILSTVAKRFKNYDLLRGMANFILDRKEKSIEYLNKEIQNHNSPAARQFISDFFENHSKTDVHRWCTENEMCYDLQVFDLENKDNGQQNQDMPVNHDLPAENAPPRYIQGKQPLVSIWMAAYNASVYIERAIESVLIQNYRNFELIVVDDGSTDATADIVRSYKNEQIKYFFKEHSGLASARNVQIKKSAGSFIVTLDSDDMMTPDFLAQHLQTFEQHPQADIVYCDDVLIDENDKPVRIIDRPQYSNYNKLISDLFHCGFPVVPFRTCIRKNVFDKIGTYDENLIVAEDYDMLRRFVKEGLRVQHLPAALYLRRINTNSHSRSFNPEKARSQFEAIRRWTETFGPEQLFPDVQWDNLPVEQRSLLGKCKAALVYLGIGQEYQKTNVSDYAQAGFELACVQLDDCCKIAPSDKQIIHLREKCRAIRAKNSTAGSHGVYQTV